MYVGTNTSIGGKQIGDSQREYSRYIKSPSTTLVCIKSGTQSQIIGYTKSSFGKYGA